MSNVQHLQLQHRYRGKQAAYLPMEKTNLPTTVKNVSALSWMLVFIPHHSISLD